MGAVPLPVDAHLTLGCFATDDNGREAYSKGQNDSCIFLPNGELIIGLHKNLIYFNHDATVRWQKKIHVHHVIRLSHDKTKILVLSANVRKYLGKKTRFDSVLVLNLNGEVLHEFDFYTRRKELLALLPTEFKHKPFTNPQTRFFADIPDVKTEFSHANSFYEIGPNALESQRPEFSRGNFIVNSIQLPLIFVLSSDLQRILWAYTPPTPKGFSEARLHDVQMQSNGKFLVYTNNSFVTPQGPASTIDEFDPVTLTSKILYQANPPHSFYAAYKGGVQRYSDNSLSFSDTNNINEVFWYLTDSKGRKTKTVRLTTKELNRDLDAIQIHKMDLSSFLKNRSGDN